MGRAILAVITAEMLWTVLWMGYSTGMQRAFPEVVDPTQPLTHNGVLLSYLVYSGIISALAGFVCAAVRRHDPMRTVWVFALIQLSLGIGFEMSYWSLMPVWYHLVFLALLVPTTVWGGSLRRAKAVRAMAAA